LKDHEYFAYIVCSRSGTLYIGMTNSIYRRALEHKRREISGFASRYGAIGWSITRASTMFTRRSDAKNS
jgi:predicted GIY-YIG superfamily endonuclease